jgi:hypothetical protein
MTGTAMKPPTRQSSVSAQRTRVINGFAGTTAS